MGSYTYTNEADMRIVDSEGLCEYFEAEEPPAYLETCEEVFERRGKEKFIDAYMSMKEELSKYFYDECTDADWFDMLNDYKVIGYWYEDLVYVLRDIALFVEGTIELVNETGSVFVMLKFEKGHLFIKPGTIKYHSEQTIEEYTGAPELPERERVMRGLS